MQIFVITERGEEGTHTHTYRTEPFHQTTGEEPQHTNNRYISTCLTSRVQNQMYSAMHVKTVGKWN